MDPSTGGVVYRKTGAKVEGVANSGRMGRDVGIRGKLVRNDLKAGILCQICEVDLKPEARVIKPGGSVEIEVPQMGAKGSRWVKFQVSFSEMDKGLEEVFEQFGTLCI